MSTNTTDSETPEKPSAGAQGKGHATPTRKEREAANKRPLVPNDRQEAKRQHRARMTQERERARLGMAVGDDRYLPARDKGPQRKFVRDYVDARYSVGELTIPFMILVILTSFIPTSGIMEIGVVAMWGYLVLVIADCYIMSYLLRRRIKEKFGSVERGTSWYAAMRAIQLRPMRMPKPQVRRRQYPS